MNIITQETLNNFTEGFDKYTEVVSHYSVELINEAIAFFIFDSVLSIIKWGTTVIAYLIIIKVLPRYEKWISLCWNG